jgi:hypothetical protein
MKLVFRAAVLAASLASLTSNAQTLLGSTVTVVGRYPTFNSVTTYPATATVGQGVEFTRLDVVPGFGVSFLPVAFDVGSSTIDLGYGYAYSGSRASFDGPVFTFDSQSAKIVGVTANANSSANYGQIQIGWTDNQVTFNFAQMAGFSPGANFRFDVALAPVPEPSTLSLSAIGLLALLSVSLMARPSSRGGA